MCQTARPAGQQRQARRDYRMGRGVQPQPLCQHDPQRHAGLCIVGQVTLRRAVDHRVEIDQPAQHFAGDGACQGAVGEGMDALGGCALGKVQGFAPAQHGIEHPHGSAAGG